MRILWIPHAGWDIPQRAHLFTRMLADKHEIHVTDWIADFRTVQDYMSLRYLRNFTYRRRREGNITIHGIPRISPAIFSSRIRMFNQRLFTRHLNRLIERYSIEVVVGTYLVPPPEGVRVIFDLFDENVAGWKDVHPQIAGEIAAVENAYFQKADAIVAASSVLKEKAERLGVGQPVYHIPNGIEFDRFMAVRDQERQPLPGTEGFQVVGSVANYENPDEIDMIMSAARALRDEPLRFYLAGRGSALTYAQTIAEREGLTNVIFPGPVARENLADVMNQFDVGLCIYKRSPMDDARSPMRLLGYSALGLPTVATAVEEIRRMDFANVIGVEDATDSIVAGIQSALGMSRVVPDTIDQYDLNTLVARYEAVITSHDRPNPGA